jgi:hypothetical protein
MKAAKISEHGHGLLRLQSFMVTLCICVSEISALVLTGGGARQGEQLFSLPFWRETLRNGLKN